MSSLQSKPGVGALTQLQMQGTQDEFIYDLRPGAETRFNQPWLQSTNHEIVQKVVPVDLTLGSTVKVVVPRRGDLLGNLSLSISLPVVPGAGINDFWREKIGYILLKKLRLVLNDVELDTSERLWLALHDDLHLKQGMRDGVAEMVGTSGLRVSQQHVVVVPLKLFCCYRPGKRQTFMPLLSSTGQNSLVLEIETETFQNAVTSYAGISPPQQLNCELIVDYVTLSEMERTQFLHQQTPLLCEVSQDCEGKSFRETIDDQGGDTVIATDVVQVDLSEVNMPVKYIAFVAYSTNAIEERRYFQYEDVIDTVQLKMDGWDRTERLDSQHFGLLQTFFHTPNCIPDRVFVYSFALDASHADQNGFFTFSHVRRPILYITLKEKRDDIVVKAFVLGYRWIDFKDGDAQIRFL